MNEFDLIKKYLERSGTYRLKNIRYYNEGKSSTASQTTMLGLIAGIPSGYCYCFGNFEISIQMAGVIVLANMNKFWTNVVTTLPGLAEVGFINHYLAIGAGMNLLGNGNYYGYKRFYGIGGNRIDLTSQDIGAATFVWSWNFNGYIFILR
jgi:hypothetical protein